MGVFGRNQSFFAGTGPLGEGMGRNPQAGRMYDVFCKVLAASFSLFFLYTTFFGLISQESHIGLYVLELLCSASCFLKGEKNPESQVQSPGRPIHSRVDPVIVYYIIEYPTLADRIGGGIALRDVIFGWFLIINPWNC